MFAIWSISSLLLEHTHNGEHWDERFFFLFFAIHSIELLKKVIIVTMFIVTMLYKIFLLYWELGEISSDSLSELSPFQMLINEPQRLSTLKCLNIFSLEMLQWNRGKKHY